MQQLIWRIQGPERQALTAAAVAPFCGLFFTGMGMFASFAGGRSLGGDACYLAYYFVPFCICLLLARFFVCRLVFDRSKGTVSCMRRTLAGEVWGPELSLADIASLQLSYGTYQVEKDNPKAGQFGEQDKQQVPQEFFGTTAFFHEGSQLTLGEYCGQDVALERLSQLADYLGVPVKKGDAPPPRESFCPASIGRWPTLLALLSVVYCLYPLWRLSQLAAAN